jgi:hypothetical protein
MFKKTIPDWEAVTRKLPVLIREFSAVVNRESIDNALCLPDFLIAEYLVKQLEALAELNKKAVAWAD